MKLKAWNANKALSMFYHSILNKIVSLIKKITKNYRNVEDIEKALINLSQSEEYVKLANSTAVKFMTKANSLETKSWREAAKATNQGHLFYETLMENINGDVRNTMLWKTIQNADLITKMPIDLSRALTQHVASETMKGRRAQDIADELHEKLGEYSKAKINLIARTEASKATTALTEARSADVGVNWYQWRTANDGNRVRSSHQHMQGVLVRWDDPPAPEELNGDESAGHYHAGDIYNCFPDSTDVNLANGCNKLWRRRYTGIVVNLRISDSTVMQATPNHPILTDRGWIAINDIQKGDYIVKRLHNASDVGKDNDHQFIPTFADAFNAMSAFCSVASSTGTKLDFHGDGTENDVDVISTDSLLRNYLESLLNQGIPKFNFTGTGTNEGIAVFNRDSGFNQSVCGVGIAHGDISLFDKFCSFLNGQPRHSDGVGFASCPSRNVIIFDDLCYSPTGATISKRQRQLTFTTDITADYLILWQAVLPSLMKKFGYVDTPSDEMILKSAVLARNASANSFNSFASAYSFCAVEDKFVSEFDGHVYNLHNDSLWYSVTQNDYVVHNCRCYAAPVILLNQVSWPAKVYYDGQIVRMTKAQFEKIM